jgi:hypothetical protein
MTTIAMADTHALWQVSLGMGAVVLAVVIVLMARFYSRVSFTNSSGNTFRGAPIYDSVTVLQRSTAEQTAIDFVRLLLSPQGRRLQQARGFLDTPVLVGGDGSAVPRTLRRYIDGCYERQRCGHRGHHHALH